MSHVIRRAGPAALGFVTVALACEPMSIELEHARSAGGASDGGAGTGAAAEGGAAADSAVGEAGSLGAGATTSGAGGTSPTMPDGAGGSASRGGTDPGPTESGGAPSDGGAPDSGPLYSCVTGLLSDVRNGHDLLPGYAAPPDARVQSWLGEMSTADRISQMQGLQVNGDFPDYSDVQRSKDLALADGSVLRGYKYRSGARGLSLKEGQADRPSDARDFATAFPAPSIRGASWDLELEWSVGEAIGDETAASMNNLLLGPSAELVRHPYWGRAQDAYGEDGYHVGRMGTAFVAGAQRHVAACAQHLVANSVEKLRADDDAVVDEQSLREIYARPLEMLVEDGGVACVQTAYNAVNETPASENAHLLRDLLKAPVEQQGFGFRGFVISEWWGTQGGQDARYFTANETEDNATALANAGLDVELPWSLNYASLASAVDAGRVEPELVADAAARVLEQKARFSSALTTDGYGLTPSNATLDGASIATNAGHLGLAERAELESAVLLANGPAGSPVLPIAANVASVAVLGADVSFTLSGASVPKSCVNAGSACDFHFATDVALGDRGTYGVNADPAESIGPFAGIQAAAAARGAQVTSGNNVAAAASADLVVVVVGLTPGDEGEEYTIQAGGDRSTLALPASQADLVNDVLSLMKPTVVIIESGSVVEVPWLSHANQQQATIWAGYGGMRAGAALGKLLFGAANFSGKLPLSWPGESALAPFEAADERTATLGYFIGYREYDRRTAAGGQVDLVFPFGRGLSYTTFAYSNAVVPCTEVAPSAVLDVRVDITNTGAVSGDEVAFLFVAGPPGTDGARSQKELKSFARVSLASGATERASLPLRIQDLRHFSTTTNSWLVDPGEYTVLVGSSGADEDLTAVGTFTVPG